jgi:preprotein translocase subunit SecD
VLRNRLTEQGFTEANVSLQGSNYIRVEIPDVSDPKQVLDIIGTPAHLTFSLASLMSLYRGGKLTGDGRLECQRDGQPYYLQDDAAVLSFFAETSSKSPEEQAKEFLSNEAFFGAELCKVPGLVESVGASLREILDKGMRTVMNEKFGV